MVALSISLDESGMVPPALITFGPWGFDVHDAGTSYGPRVLPDFDFIWIIDGDVVWEHDGLVASAPAGSLILARPGMCNVMRWDPRITSRNFYLHFTLTGRADLPPERDWPTVLRLPQDDVARPLLRHLAALLERRPRDWQRQAESALLCLLQAYVNERFDTVSGTARLPAAVESCITHVARLWSRGILSAVTLPELARVARVSREHLCRVFRDDLGLAPVEGFRLARLERATVLLGRRDLSISEIARLTGFDDAFHFSRRFRDAFGCPPSVFRSRLATGAGGMRALPHRVRALSRRLWEQAGGPR